MADSLNTYNEDQTNAEPADHTLAMLEKAEQLEKNNNPDRPDWLPEKFKSVEDMAQAYNALESKLGQPNDSEDYDDDAEIEDVDPDEVQELPDNEEVSEVLGAAGLDFDVLASEYNELGELTTDAYEALEEAGFPRTLVDSYIQGQEALASSMNNEMFELAGGEEGYQDMMSWASENLQPNEVNTFNRTVDSGDPASVRFAVQGLVARYRSEVGTEPRLIQGNNAPVSGGKFESAAELTAAMRDPRYDKDPAYRQQVAAKLSRSSVF